MFSCRHDLLATQGSIQIVANPVIRLFCKVNVPTNAILLGAKGSSSSSEITQLAK